MNGLGMCERQKRNKSKLFVTWWTTIKIPSVVFVPLVHQCHRVGYLFQLLPEIRLTGLMIECPLFCLVANMSRDGSPKEEYCYGNIF